MSKMSREDAKAFIAERQMPDVTRWEEKQLVAWMDALTAERDAWQQRAIFAEEATANAFIALERWRDEPDHDEQFVMDAIAILSGEAP